MPHGQLPSQIPVGSHITRSGAPRPCRWRHLPKQMLPVAEDTARASEGCRRGSGTTQSMNPPPQNLPQPPTIALLLPRSTTLPMYQFPRLLPPRSTLPDRGLVRQYHMHPHQARQNTHVHPSYPVKSQPEPTMGPAGYGYTQVPFSRWSHM